MDIVEKLSGLVRLRAVLAVIIINFLTDGEGIITLSSPASSQSDIFSVRTFLLEVWQ